MCSAAEYCTGSDVDDVAREMEEEFKEALAEFELEKEDLSSVVEDDDSHCSNCVPCRPDSDMEQPSDSCIVDSEQEGIDSDDEAPKQAMLDKL